MLETVYLVQNNFKTELAYVLDQFNADRCYLGDGYYRLQDFGNGIYELEFSIAGPCSTFDPHPAIKFQLTDASEIITPLYYRDMVLAPIKFFKPETQAELTFVQSALRELVRKFYQAKSTT